MRSIFLRCDVRQAQNHTIDFLGRNVVLLLLWICFARVWVS